MSAILTSGQPPGMRTKKGGGIGFMYDSPPPIFGNSGATANNSSDGGAKKEYSERGSILVMLTLVLVCYIHIVILSKPRPKRVSLGFCVNTQKWGMKPKLRN